MVAPFHRGFFCDDASLTYPYHSSTVSNGMLMCIMFILPIVVFIIVEWWRLRSQDSGIKSSKICGRNIHPLLGAAGASFGIYWLGLTVAFMINMLIKFSIGRLRPHFIEVCKPDWSQIQCYTSDGKPAYVDPIPCTGEQNSKMLNSRLSFPSGHASLSMFTMLYLTIYLHVHLRMRYTCVLRVIFQVAFLTIALYTGLSRIHDYKHHWEDVLAGFVEGIIEALLWTNYVANLVPKKSRHPVTIVQDNEKERIAETEEHLMEKVI
ncbi:unnamed protein product, partial [Meganyctiphanes norvegica]